MTVHTLRHSFATHLQNAPTSAPSRFYSATTICPAARYAKVSNSLIRRTTSPAEHRGAARVSGTAMSARLKVADIFRRHGEVYRQVHDGYLGSHRAACDERDRALPDRRTGRPVYGCRSCGRSAWPTIPVAAGTVPNARVRPAGTGLPHARMNCCRCSITQCSCCRLRLLRSLSQGGTLYAAETPAREANLRHLGAEIGLIAALHSSHLPSRLIVSYRVVVSRPTAHAGSRAGRALFTRARAVAPVSLAHDTEDALVIDGRFAVFRVPCSSGL